jgi:hypothetical protein
VRYSVIVLLTMILLLLGLTLVSAHENSGKTHTKGGTGHCYGWHDLGGNIRICYLDKEKDQCKTIIYSHGLWHESADRECTEDDKG